MPTTIIMNLPQSAQRVIDALRESPAVPFLELATVTDLPDDELRPALVALESYGLVSRSNVGNDFEEVVTVTARFFEQL